MREIIQGIDTGAAQPHGVCDEHKDAEHRERADVEPSVPYAPWVGAGR
ncbi:hypothetical protein GCM10025857_09450 [Alicyclobacillus contaminans]|nr:hypothetical protein GCM10025857_09450 [Alicyclobacillus contaminans]